MASRKNWLNSTGTCRKVEDVYFSYHQQMTANYKGYTLFDSGFYSMTTRKHQGLIRCYVGYNTINLEHADFNKGVNWSIMNEIEYLEHNIEQLQSKRKTKKCLDTIDECTNKIIRLQELLNT